MKKTIILDITAKGFEEYDPGNYDTQPYGDWWYEITDIQWNGKNALEMFETHKNVRETLLYNQGETGFFYDEVELEIIISIQEDRVFYQEVDITDFLTEDDLEDIFKKPFSAAA
jgi:hypothetical protein